MNDTQKTYWELGFEEGKISERKIIIKILENQIKGCKYFETYNVPCVVCDVIREQLIPIINSVPKEDKQNVKP